MAAGRASTWLITGASSGLGNSIALKALAAGHKVIGATRDVEKAKSLCPEFSAKGGIWLGLDPAQKDAYDQFSKYSQEYDVDVLVNSARYETYAPSEDEVRDQMEVNFYGALRSVRGCLPTMRAKRSGHVVLLSSIAGYVIILRLHQPFLGTICFEKRSLLTKRVVREKLHGQPWAGYVFR